jgi:predicted nicotinamide N-methyase
MAAVAPVKTAEARRAFILANTRPQAPPHCPEITLHLADEVTPIWRMTEAALETIGLPPPFWAFAWAGGQGLARWLLDNPRAVAGQRVVDFATGSGLVAIAAMRAGAAHVLASDIDPFAVEAARLNAAANRVALTVTGEDLLDSPPPEADLILAGDICYEKPLAERVLAWLRAGHAAGARVLIGDPRRSYFPRDGLVHLAEYRVPTSRELEDQAIKQTGVYELR